MKEIRNYIVKNKLGKVYENKSFKEYTTLKVGGKIRLVYFPNTIENFLTFYRFFKKFKYPMFVIGAGSNVLASDKDFDGVVVNFTKLDLRYAMIGDECIAYPGCSVVKLSYDLAARGYTGGEFLCGIPATIGGAVYMNAGANGRETKDILISARLLSDEEIKEYSKEELQFSYRRSLLQEKPMIVLEARLSFQKEKSKGQPMERIRELKALRKRTQPIEKLSAGCTFQNPPGFYAWELIDKAGLRGYAVNDAQVSEKHSNFLINNGHATSEDMIRLIDIIQKKVKKQFDIDLKCEWILVNFD